MAQSSRLMLRLGFGLSTSSVTCVATCLSNPWSSPSIRARASFSSGLNKAYNSSDKPSSKGSNDAFGSLPQLPQRRVVVTGIGIVSPVGVGTTVSWEALVAGRTGLRKLQHDDLPEVRSFGVVPRHSLVAASSIKVPAKSWGTEYCIAGLHHLIEQD